MNLSKEIIRADDGIVKYLYYTLAFAGAVVWAWFFLTGFALESSEAGLSPEEISSRVEERVPELMDYYNIPGAGVALIREGEVTWSQVFGYADQEKSEPATSDTLFRAESISKSVTVWAVMKLVEEGRIGFDEPVENHLSRWQFPDTEFSTEKVTVKKLLSHSAGLPGGIARELGEERPPLVEVLEGRHGLPKAELLREPGTAFEYSNPGFVLLELLVEELTGQDYRDYLQEEIMSPLGVEEFYFDADQEIRSAMATSYHYNGTPVLMYQDPFRGAGGLIISVENLARFWTAGMPGKDSREPGRGVLRPGSVELLHTPVVEPTGFYGLGSDGSAPGHFIDILSGGEKAIYHGGEGIGSMGKAYIIPEDGKGIVILTNSKRSWPLLFELTGDWAELNGYSRPAMSNVFSIVKTIIRVLTVTLVLVSTVKLGVLLYGLISRRRLFAPLACTKRFSRFLNIGLALLALLLWWLIKEMVIFNLLPVIYHQLGLALLFFAITVMLTAMFPAYQKNISFFAKLKDVIILPANRQC